MSAQTADEALAELKTIAQQYPLVLASGIVPSGAIDLSLLLQILPLLAIIFPQFAPLIPIIQKLLDLLGFSAAPGSTP